MIEVYREWDRLAGIINDKDYIPPINISQENFKNNLDKFVLDGYNTGYEGEKREFWKWVNSYLDTGMIAKMIRMEKK